MPGVLGGPPAAFARRGTRYCHHGGSRTSAIGECIVATLPSMAWRQVVRAFGKNGWQHDRTRGSHYIMIRPGRPGLLSVPMHDPLRKGTLRKLIRQGGLTVEEFMGSVD